MTRTLAVITGASSGIGATFARKLAPQHDLLLVARRKDRLEQVAAELSSAHNANVDVLVADLGKSEDTDTLAERIANNSRLELLINNAGFGTLGRFWEAPLESQEQMHRLHVMATVRLTHAALNNLVPRNVGGIINVASVAGFARSQGSVSYCATKTWMNVFSEGIYLELKSMKSRVKIQTLCPGFTASEFHQTLGLASENLAAKPLWLTADQVVNDSLAAFARGKLYVIPGWKYKVMTGLVSKLPTGLRLFAELAGAKTRSDRV